MLHSNILPTDRTRLTLSTENQSDHLDGGGVGDIVKFVISFARRQYLVVIITTLLACGASLLYLRFVPPTYTAQVQVLLGPPRAQFVQQQSFLAEPAFDATQIETQLELLKSKVIATAVLRRLRLADDPEFNGSGASVGSLLRWVRALIVSPPNPPQSDEEDASSEALIRAFLTRLSVNRVGVSNVINISFNSRTPSRAAEIVNAVANAYVTDQLEAKFEANRRATSWLQERLRDLGEQALTAERGVDAYKAQNNIVSSEGKLLDEQLISQLNSRLAAAQAQTSEATAKLARYESIISSSSAKPPSIDDLDAIGNDATGSQILTTLRQQYLELARREAELSARVGRDHLAVVNIRNRMREYRGSIVYEVKRLAEISRSDAELAKQRQLDIEKQLSEAVSKSRSITSAELTIRDLESRARGLRSLYENFQQRYMGSTQQETFPISETRVIFPAAPPQTKSKPKTQLVLGVGVIAGLVLGIAFGLLRDVMDGVFRTSSQVESCLELPCLSLVPVLRPPKTLRSPGKPQQPNADPASRTILNVPPIHRAVVGMPLSRFTEAIRSIKLAIDQNPTKSPNRVIGITSALPNEGKTTIAASLAQLIGHSGKRVIIVDCDLRNPSLTTSMTPKASAGLIEVTNGSRSLEDILWRDPKTNLALLPAVQRGELLHTSEILSTDAICKLFEGLRQAYDYVVVDLPPLTPLVDVRVTAPFIDCYVLVVEWGRTKVEVVQHALHTAPTISDSLIGAVLNKTDIKAMGRYDASRRDYYDDSHYLRYGFSDS